MQVKKKINGRDALVNYVKTSQDGGLEPVPPDQAEMIKIIYLDNGERVFALPEEKEAAQDG